MDDPIALSRAALESFAREDGRSAWLCVRSPWGEWSGGVGEDVIRPAVSLLKLALAMAAEQALGDEPDRLTVPVADLIGDADDASVLAVLRPDLRLSAGDLLGLALCASDGPSARWHLEQVGIDEVNKALITAGCVNTTAYDESGSLMGTTTARDAVTLLRAAADPRRFPITTWALEHSIRNSRIPLGATDLDVQIAHKTGSLPGVAHDVATIIAKTGAIDAAFLTEEQHDLLITGYEMGICTRGVMDAWGLSGRRTLSALVDL